MHCNHGCVLCTTLYQKGCAKSAGVMFITNHDNTDYVLGGCKTRGCYAGLFSLPGGKMISDDEKCFKRCLIRELKEELKLELKISDFNRLFIRREISGQQHFQLFLCGPTPIFYTSELTLCLTEINNSIIRELNTPAACSDTPDNLEICRVDRFSIITGLSVTDTLHEASKYLLECIKLYKEI